MNPRDIQSLLQMLLRNRTIDQLMGNLLAQWGPKNRRMLSAEFLPPRPVALNQDTIEKVRYRTVAAVDGDRHSPAQLVDGGEVYGKLHYRLGDSDLLRIINGRDYDAVVMYLKQNMGLVAAGRVIGLLDTMILQALVEHDELANWEALTAGTSTRRGDNAYLEYEALPDLTTYCVESAADWTSDDSDPWVTDIIPRVQLLVDRGFDPGGIRCVTTYRVLTQLANHPATLRRIVRAPLATGQSVQEAVGSIGAEDVKGILKAKLGIKSVESHDLRIMTRTGEKRAYPESTMTFIASTGQSEEVMWNQDDPADVRLVEDVVGYTAIGTVNGQGAPGRKAWTRSFTDQKDPRIEFEGAQTTGPIILEPQAITNLYGIDLS